MKFGLWILITAVSAWSVNGDRWIPTAMATMATSTITHVQIDTITTVMTDALHNVYSHTSYVTHTSTSTTTTTNSDGPRTTTDSGAQTDTNCHTGGANDSRAGPVEGTGQYNYCNRSDPNQQRNTQDDTKDNNDKGADKSSALGMAAIMAGMALVAAGVALLPPPTTPIGTAMIAAGMALIAAGMAALAAAKKMDNNANKAGNNANKLTNLTDAYKSTISTAQGTNNTGTSDLGTVAQNDLGGGNTSGIRIDPALMRSGKMDTIFGDMEKKTGLNRDDVLAGLKSGQTPLNMLANSPALKGKSAGSEDNLNKMMSDTMANGKGMSGQEVMDKLGLTDGDLTVNPGGGDANRNLASNKDSTPNIDALFPNKGADASGSTGGNPNMKLSPEVQAALDKNGITSKTIFEMVHSKYIRVTPMMFGVPERKPNPTAENPYNGLSGEKVDI